MVRRLLFTGVVVSLGAAAFGGPAAFVLDSPQSNLAISGSVNGAALQQQGPGSLTTTYSGSFLVNLTPSTLQFVAGGSADANVNGNWDPTPDGVAGTAPADYGAQANFGIFGTARFAVRNLVADGNSDAIALNPDLTFAANGATVAITSGVVAYRSVLGSGTSTLVGTSGQNAAPGNGTITIVRNLPASTATATLTIPVSATVVDNIDPVGTATITFNGSFRGGVTTIAGDANFDKTVNLDDFTALAGSFGGASSWLGGDFTGDNTVSLDDFTALAANFGQTAPAAPARAVPEPLSAAGLLLAGLGLIRRRRRNT